MVDRTGIILLAVFYTLLVGFFTVQQGIGITLTSFGLLILLTRRLRARGIRFGVHDWIDFSAAVCLALIPAVATNSRVLAVSGAGLGTFILLLVLRTIAPAGVVEFQSTLPLLSKLPRLRLDAIVRVFSLACSSQGNRDWRRFVIGALLSVPAVLVFDQLFAAVNHSYEVTTRWVVHLIFDPIVILRSVQIAVQFIFLAAVLSLDPLEHGEMSSDSRRTPVVTLARIPVLALFILFRSFQSTAGALTSAGQPFAEISKYVQQGFLGTFGRRCDRAPLFLGSKKIWQRYFAPDERPEPARNLSNHAHNDSLFSQARIAPEYVRFQGPKALCFARGTALGILVHDDLVAHSWSPFRNSDRSDGVE